MYYDHSITQDNKVFDILPICYKLEAIYFFKLLHLLHITKTTQILIMNTHNNLMYAL